MNEKIAVLSKAVWTYTDIMSWKECNKDTAYKFLRRAQNECGGTVKAGVQYAKTDSVLSLFGTSRKEELSIYEQIAEVPVSK